MRGQWRKLGWVVLAGVVAASLWACTNPPVFPDTPNYFITFNPVNLDSLPGTATALRFPGFYDSEGLVAISVSRAEYDAMPRLWAYQLWAVSRSGNTITKSAHTPKFIWDPYSHTAIQPDGSTFQDRKFNFQTDISQFDEIVLTIEPYPDYFMIEANIEDTARVEVVEQEILSGGQQPDLEFLVVEGLSATRGAYEMRFPVADAFDSASGSYFLANTTAGESTPSEITGAANYGLWFGQAVSLGGGVLDIEPSLDLPTLPDGWVYEGWVIPPAPNPKNPLSLGRFTDPTSADDDSSYSGVRKVAATLPLPGEDFLQNPPNVLYDFPMNLWVDRTLGTDTGWVFITVEPNRAEFAGINPTSDPSPDIAPGPFSYRILQLRLPAVDPNDSNTWPEFNQFDLSRNTFPMANMHGRESKFGQPGAPLVECELSSQ